MTVIEDVKTLGRERRSFSDEGDIEEFVSALERYEQGLMTADEWRAFRLVRGTYGQRQAEDAQMLRVKIPQGVLDAAQLRALADVATNYSRGFCHVTTRQNVQFHFLKLHDAAPAMTRLAEAGLTTREACGNSVRNITACPYAGIARDEVFDVTPYAEALTRFLLRHPLSSTLPRKFKIAFEGCPEDHALTAINDLGFQARVASPGKPERGFRVVAGGGTAILCTSAAVLFDFLPADQIFDVAEAVLRVFKSLGDYKHRQRNRMKFLIKELGWDAWRARFDEALQDVRKEGGHRLPFDPERPPVEDAPKFPRRQAPSASSIQSRVSSGEVRGPGITPEVRPETVTREGFDAWAKTNLEAQKQTGYAAASVTLTLGDITAEQLKALAELALAYGDGTVRTTHDQNLLIRWVPWNLARDLFSGLAAAGLSTPGAGGIADVVSCPGAEACRLAVTQSRGLGRLLATQLRERADVADVSKDLKIKISGCPNGCGQHHVAGIGFQGSVRRLGRRAVPQYFVMIGGGVDPSGGAHFGRIAAKIPARRLFEAVTRLVALYKSEHQPEEPADAFFRRLDLARAKTLLGDLEVLTAEAAMPEDFVDLGENDEFKVEIMDGECSA